jgi:NAD(P)-dependent dehydrogenase (short-subunit alcohol dehydrogenase family)
MAESGVSPLRGRVAAVVGGRGVAVQVDHTVESDVAALFDRIGREQGRLDVVANAVWGGNETWASLDWNKPFGEQPTEGWRLMMEVGVRAYLLSSVYAARIMAATGGGLITHLTDGIDGYRGQLYWDLAHEAINRMAAGMGRKGKTPSWRAVPDSCAQSECCSTSRRMRRSRLLALTRPRARNTSAVPS